MECKLKLKNASHLIQKKFNIIGSEDIEEKTNTIVISSNSISKKHAIIDNSGNGIQIMDLCSDSGTKLNGQFLTPMKWYTVTEKQVIGFGFIEAILELKDEIVLNSPNARNDLYSSYSERRRLEESQKRKQLSAPPNGFQEDTELASGYHSKYDLVDVPETSVYIPETQYAVNTESELIRIDGDLAVNYAKQLESQNMLTDLDYEPSYVTNGRIKEKVDVVSTFSQILGSDDDELSLLNLGEKSYAEESNPSRELGAATPDIFISTTTQSMKKALNRSATPDIDLPETELMTEAARELSVTPDIDVEEPTNVEDEKLQKEKIQEENDLDDFFKPPPRQQRRAAKRSFPQSEVETQIFELDANDKQESPSSPAKVFEIETQVFMMPDDPKPKTRKQAKLKHNIPPTSRKSAYELQKEMRIFDTETQPLILPDDEMKFESSDKENNAYNAAASFDMETQPLIVGKPTLKVVQSFTSEPRQNQTPSNYARESGSGSESKSIHGKKNKDMPKKRERNQILNSSSDEDEDRSSPSLKIPPPTVVDMDGPSTSGMSTANERTPERKKSIFSQDGSQFDTPADAKFPSLTDSQYENLDFDDLNKSQPNEKFDEVVFIQSDDEEIEENRIEKEKIEQSRQQSKNVKLLKYEAEANAAFQDQPVEKPSKNQPKTVRKIDFDGEKQLANNKNSDDSEDEFLKEREAGPQKVGPQKSSKKTPKYKEVRSKVENVAFGSSNEKTARSRVKKRPASDRVDKIPPKKARTPLSQDSSPETTVVIKRSLANSLKSFKIALSNIENTETLEKIKNLVIQMGGKIVDDIYDASILIIGGKIKLTCKTLSAISKGIPIVSESWLNETIQAGKLADPYKHIIRDKEHEKKYDYSLKNVLKAAASKQPLKNYSIIVTSSTKPEPLEMKKIIQCSGAKYYKGSSRTLPKDKNSFVVTELDKDRKECLLLKEKLKNVKFISCKKFIINIILKQNLDLSELLKI